MKNLVFIVEDNIVQQKILKVHFEEMLGNYMVKTFEDPEQMFEHMKEKPFAIVLDHFFQNKNNKTGLDYLKLMRKNFPSVPIIYYTSLDDKNIREEVLSLGAEDYILKNSASLVRLRTALDVLHERKKEKKGFFKRLFGK